MIQNINLKLNGSLPVNRKELIELISSWGRISNIQTNDRIKIDECKTLECYNLSKLDVSQIEDLSEIFSYSPYNDDLSKWDVSNCINMDSMFYKSKFNNDSLKNWLHTSKHSFGISFLDSKNSYNKQLLYFTKLASICKQIVFNFYFYLVSNIENMAYMFYLSNFNGNISNWDVSNIKKMKSMFDNCPFCNDISKWQFNIDVFCYEMFEDNKSFENKYNDGNKIPDNTKYFLKWLEENREKIRETNLPKEEILDFFSFDNDIEKVLI